jgi:hypothetical protein
MTDDPSHALPKKRFAKSTLQNIVLGGLALGVLGLLMTWVSAGFISASGLDTSDGKLYGVLLLVAGLFVVLWRRDLRSVFGIIALVFALLMEAVAVYDVVHVSTEHGPFGISFSPGIGLIFDAVAGLGTSVAIWKLVRWKSDPVVVIETDGSVV